MENSPVIENAKMPFLPSEALRTQRVEVYLSDLKARLRQLRLQHDSVIQNSVDIIKEIDEVSATFRPPATSDAVPGQQHSQKDQPSKHQVSKIKQLIRDFEKVMQPRGVPVKSDSCAVAITAGVNASNDIQCKSKELASVRRILQKFERLNECCVLRDSLSLFQRAKESLDKIETIFDGCDQDADESAILAQQQPVQETTVESCASESATQFVSCCSSVMSMDTFHSTEDLLQLTAHTEGSENQQQPPTTSVRSVEKGYDGDNDDSECDVIQSTKKRKAN